MVAELCLQSAAILAVVQRQQPRRHLLPPLQPLPSQLQQGFAELLPRFDAALELLRELQQCQQDVSQQMARMATLTQQYGHQHAVAAMMAAAAAEAAIKAAQSGPSREEQTVQHPVGQPGEGGQGDAGRGAAEVAARAPGSPGRVQAGSSGAAGAAAELPAGPAPAQDTEPDGEDDVTSEPELWSDEKDEGNEEDEDMLEADEVLDEVRSFSPNCITDYLITGSCLCFCCP